MAQGSDLVVLASASPRRRDLIRALGVPVEIAPSEVDESVQIGMAPKEQVSALATRKAGAGALTRPGLVVLGADTIVVHEGIVLNKPVDSAEAERMLRRLRGADHLVHTGLAIVLPDGMCLTKVVTSTVRMRTFSDAELDAYLATGESMDKAGAYGIQGAAGDIVASVDGCYTNVVGLPLCATARLMIEAGIPVTGDIPNCAFKSDDRCPCWPNFGR